MTITRLSLSNFRNYTEVSFRPVAKFIVLHGDNGAGKTNILEAVSLLVPGRGLRRTAMSEMVRQGGDGGFVIAAEMGDIAIGTGVTANAPERRKVRINGANAAINSLAEWLSVIWLTPAMDRLFVDGASARRQFLDRLVLAVEPAHARYSSRYETALRQRNRLLGEHAAPDPAWLDAIESGMAENGVAINISRSRILSELGQRLSGITDSVFATPMIAIQGNMCTDAAELQAIWAKGRKRDAAAGRTLIGPHRNDLAVHHAPTGQAAARCSTGEQKALLLSIILAHAELVADRRGNAPVILLDEVAAHLDPSRRAALFARLDATGSQVWMTGTESNLFSSIDHNAMLIEISNGKLVQ
jgi:DNA replication and repair protein RecF